MNESIPKGGWKLGRDSFSKMICWFKDGNRRTMFSLDWHHRYSKRRDRLIGLERFQKKANQYGKLASTIEIYDKETGEMITKYRDGVEQKEDEAG